MIWMQHIHTPRPHHWNTYAPTPTLGHTTPYLSINPEGACLLIQLDGCDTWNFPCLLDVAAMAADGQAHQIRPHHKLILEGGHQLPGVLHKHKEKKFWFVTNSSFGFNQFTIHEHKKKKKKKTWLVYHYFFLSFIWGLMLCSHQKQSEFSPCVTRASLAAGPFVFIRI